MAGIFFSFNFVSFCLAPDDCLFIYFTLGRKKKESVWKISTSMVDTLKVVRYAIWGVALGLLGNQWGPQHAAQAGPQEAREKAISGKLKNQRAGICANKR